MTEEATAERVGDIDWNQLWWHIDVAAAALVDEHDGARGGGAFHLRTATGMELYKDVFRNPDSEETAEYARLAVEKTARLAQHPEHLLSWESKEDAAGQHQGGVRAPNGLLGAFSGFSAEAAEAAEEDEVLVLWVFTKMDWMSVEQAREAALVSSNRRYTELMKKFDRAATEAE